MRTMFSALLATALATGFGGTAAAQAPAPPGAAPSPQATAPAAPAPVDTFTYEPGGRRDPFVSLLTRSERRGSSQAGDGLAGLAVDELSVRGIVATSTGYIAMVKGPDGKTFLVRPDDRLLDGTIKAITAQGLVILQDVSDPLSLVKQKEVHKMLHGNEEGK